MKIGEKLPPHQELSNRLKVSLKTTHDALQILIKKGYLLARRGTYGTTVIKIPGELTKTLKFEDKIFKLNKLTERVKNLYYIIVNNICTLQKGNER